MAVKLLMFGSYLDSKGFHFWRKLTKWLKTTLVEKILIFDEIWQNLPKSTVVKCKTVVFFIILLWISTYFHHSSRIHLIASIVYISQWIINNILNVGSTGFVSLTVLMMSLVTLQFKSLYWVVSLAKSAFFDERKMTFWRQNPLGPNHVSWFKELISALLINALSMHGISALDIRCLILLRYWSTTMS